MKAIVLFITGLFFALSAFSQNRSIKNGLYKGYLPNDIHFMMVRNDTVLIHYPSRWGCVAIKGKVSGDSLIHVAFHDTIRSSIRNFKKEKLSGKTVVMCRVFCENKLVDFEKDRRFSIGFESKNESGYYNKDIENVKYSIQNGVLNFEIPEIKHDSIQVTFTSIHGRWGSVILHLATNNAYSFDAILEYSIRYQELPNIYFEKNYNQLIFTYSEAIASDVNISLIIEEGEPLKPKIIFNPVHSFNPGIDDKYSVLKFLENVRREFPNIIIGTLESKVGTTYFVEEL